MRGRLACALVLTWSLPLSARGDVQQYGVRLPSGGLVVDVPYTLGTHHEHVTTVQGALRIDPEASRLEGGRLVIPLAAFRDDDAKRACHLREALGLDYTRSRYPREHACDDANHLPERGPDAIAFPEIVVDLERGEPAGALGGKLHVEGRVTIHGITRPVGLDLTVSHDASPGMLRVRGTLPLRLRDFGVTVKSAGALFVSISVADEVTVRIDTLLEPVRGAPAEQR